MVISVGKLLLMLITGALWDAIKGIYPRLLMSSQACNWTRSSTPQRTLRRACGRWQRNFTVPNNASNASFLGAFIIGFIALTLVVETMGGAAFKTARSVQKGEDGASLGSFSRT